MKFWHEIVENLRIALESVRTNKLRSFLATLGIVIGVFTATLMATAITGLGKAFENSISAIGSDVIYIQRFNWGPSEKWWKVRARRPISLVQARRLAERVGATATVSYESGMGGTVKYLDRTASSVIIMGNIAASAEVRGLTIKEGRFLSEAEVDGERPVCVLGHDLAERLFPYESGLGAWVKVNDRRYQVVGTLEKMGEFIFANLDFQVIIPVTRMIADFTRDPELTIAVKTGDAAALDEVQEELRWIMRTVRGVEPGEEDDFSVNNQNALLDMFGKFTAVIGTAGLSMTGLALLVGGIGIMNVMFVSVTERTREIGVRKAPRDPFAIPHGVSRHLPAGRSCGAGAGVAGDTGDAKMAAGHDFPIDRRHCARRVRRHRNHRRFSPRLARCEAEPRRCTAQRVTPEDEERNEHTQDNRGPGDHRRDFLVRPPKVCRQTSNHHDA
jgi:putative ABC transport system permease protein